MHGILRALGGSEHAFLCRNQIKNKNLGALRGLPPEGWGTPSALRDGGAWRLSANHCEPLRRAAGTDDRQHAPRLPSAPAVLL